MALLKEIDEVIDHWLGLSEQEIGRAPQYQHRAALLHLAESGPEFSEDNLMDQLLQIIQQRAQGGSAGTLNFAFRQVTTLDEHSTSREVTLERRLVRAAIEAQRRDLGNMMPVVSGVFGVQAHARTAIDLVQQQGGQFCLIELKVDSNTPLSAAMQIVCYAACYVAARNCPSMFGCDETVPVFSSDEVRLQVLAPHEYYMSDRRHVVPWLQALSDRLDRDLSQGQSPGGTGNHDYFLSFEFQHFPREFSWNAVNASDSEHHQLALTAFDERVGL